jgi:hypothetical protein
VRLLRLPHSRAAEEEQEVTRRARMLCTEIHGQCQRGLVADLPPVRDSENAAARSPGEQARTSQRTPRASVARTAALAAWRACPQRASSFERRYPHNARRSCQPQRRLGLLMYATHFHVHACGNASVFNRALRASHRSTKVHVLVSASTRSNAPPSKQHSKLARLAGGSTMSALLQCNDYGVLTCALRQVQCAPSCHT